MKKKNLLLYAGAALCLAFLLGAGAGIWAWRAAGAVDSTVTLDGNPGADTSADSAGAEAYIGSESALTAALGHAGVSSGAAERQEIALDADDGHMVYDVEFYAEGYEYDYEIDALTGEVLFSGREQERYAPLQSGGGTPAAGGDIGEARAKEIALGHAGVSSGDAVWRQCKPDYEDGARVYELEFTAGGYEYEYEIDAAAGGVLKSGKELQSGGGTPAAGGDIGEARAKEIALGHAGVSSGDAVWRQCKPDYEDGARVYELEFTAGGYEYEYEIDAASGTVLDFECELDD